MQALTAPALLQAWERALGTAPPGRARVLLQHAWPEVDPAVWDDMPIGTRDAWLLRLHEALFDAEIDTLAACPTCGETLQTLLPPAGLIPRSADPAPGAGAVQPVLTLHTDGYELAYRLPCYRDLAEIAHAPPDLGASQLLARCVVAVRHSNGPADAADLPVAVIESLQQAMADADPGADLSIGLHCPACGHDFERRLDVDHHVWDELDDWAEQTLIDVHLLAGAYGWSEAEILALSGARRAHYITLVQS